MTKREELEALAERVERAEGPSEELDYAIDAALGSPEPGFPVRDYTASEDAARKVAPEGWYLRVEPRFYSEEGEVRWRAHAIKPDWSRWTPHDDWFETIENIDADEPALALAAAALRARAAGETA